MTSPTTKTNSTIDYVKSFAWLVEAAFRGFAGYALLSHLKGYVVVVAAIYSLATAAMIVAIHFVNAHKK